MSGDESMEACADNYTTGARIYDRINEIPTRSFVEQVLNRLDALGFEFRSCVEYGCGSGLALEQMVPRCDRLAGCDVAGEMIAHARNRLPEHVMLANEDMRLFRPTGRFELALCVNECINYLPSLAEWRKFILNVRDGLIDGGMFVLEFDTLYDMSHVWSDNVNVYDGDDFHCVKSYAYDEFANCGSEHHVIFLRNGAHWVRQVEKHRLYSFPHADILEICTGSGFTVRALQDGDTGRDFVLGTSLRCVLYLEKRR